MASHRQNAVREAGTEAGLGPGAALLAELSVAEDKRSKLQKRMEKAGWLLGSALILYFGDLKTNFFSLAMHDDRVNRTALHIALACVGVNTVLFLYLAVYMRHVMKVEEEWDVAAPNVIQTLTLLGVIAGISLSVAFWRIWHLLTLPILFILFMGFIIVMAALPPYSSKVKKPSQERVD